MKLEVQKISEKLLKIVLMGRMDMQGAQEIDLKFAAATTIDHGGVIVDMSAVEFLASIGIRTLVVNAKALTNRHSRMVLLGPDANVTRVLEMAGIDVLIPIVRDEASALAAVSGA